MPGRMTNFERFEPQLSIEEVTPEQAFDLLAKNTHNRKLRQGVVDMYARDMKAGRWMPGVGDPIMVATDDTVRNGQHRLMAIIESDTTVRLPFIRGVPKDAQDVVDQGAKRTFADVLELHYGHDTKGNSRKLAAAVRMVAQYRLGGVMGAHMGDPGGRMTISELTRHYLNEPNLSASIPFEMRFRRAGFRQYSGAVITALHYLFNEIDPNEADPFFEALVTGANLEEGSPILLLRTYMMGPDWPNRARPQAALIIKAFNYWREGRHLTRLRWQQGGSRPEEFPKIAPAQERDELEEVAAAA